MENQAQIFTKATSEGDDKMIVLQPGQALIQKMNLGDWTEIRIGMMVGFTTIDDLDAFFATNPLVTLTQLDPGTLWSFGMKDDRKNQLVDEDDEIGKFVGIHSIAAEDGITGIDRLDMRNGFSEQNDPRQHFAFLGIGTSRGMAYMAKNGNVIHKATSSFMSGEPAHNSFGIAGRQQNTSSDGFANPFALRIRKIEDNKLRIWLGRTSGFDSEGNITLARLMFYLDNFSSQLIHPQNPADVIDIDDPFVGDGTLFPYTTLFRSRKSVV